MSLFYDEDDTGSQFEKLATEQGIEDGAQKSDSWTDSQSYAGIGSAIGNNIAQAVEITAQKGALVGSAVPIAGDKIRQLVTGDETDTRAQDWYFASVVDPTTKAIDYFAPDPETTGHAAQVLGGLVGGFSQLAMGGGVNMATNAFSSTAMNLQDQGVDQSTAMQAAVVQAGAMTLAFSLLPGYGATLAKQVLSGAGLNLATGAAATQGTRSVLDSAGYDKQAEQFDPLDLEARAIDVVMGAAFGGQNYLGIKLNSRQRDTVAAVAAGKSFAVDTLPGRPVDDGAMAAHQINMGKAIDAVTAGRPLMDAELKAGDFEPKPLSQDAEAMRAAIKEATPKEAVVDSAPVAIRPDQYAAELYTMTAAKDGLTPEAFADLEQFSKPDRNPVSGLFSDDELQASLMRAAASDAPMRYVEADTHNLGGVNSALGSNTKADAVISEMANAYAGAFDGHPVYHRGAGRFAAVVPDGFDIAGAQAKADAAVAEIVKKYGLEGIEAKKGGPAGARLWHGQSEIIKGGDLDSIIKPAQDAIEAQKPTEAEDVNRSEAFKAWIESPGGEARRAAQRAGEARRSAEASGGSGEEASRRAAQVLGRSQSKRPGGLRTGDGSNRSKTLGFLDPASHAASAFRKIADRHGIAPDVRGRYAPKVNRDKLTGWYTNSDRAATIARAMEVQQNTGKEAAYVVADISNLGGMNKALGQHVADEVFKQFSEILLDHANTLGADVVPFRHGGDEISFVISGSDAEQARVVMEKAAADVQRYVNRIGINDLPHAKHIGKTEKYGAGVYVGVEPIAGNDINRIMDAADEQVELNKSAGKADVGAETMPLAADDYANSYAGTPEMQQALEAGESIRLLDDDGNVVSARDALLKAAEDVDNAKQLADGFKAAAACSMRFV